MENLPLKNLNFENLETNGVNLVDFGMQPVSNRFLVSDQEGEAPRFPLALRIREDIGLIYIEKPFPIEELKPRYDWLTCFEPEDHLDDLVKKIIDLPNISKESIFGAYSFKDDSTLQRLERLGYNKTWRIDPKKDLEIFDECANVETYQFFLTNKSAKKIINRNGLADVLIVRHVVEHSYDLTSYIEFIKSLVKPGGYIVWELPDCERALSNGDCTTIWEEHIYYFTSFTFRKVISQFNFDIIHFESVPYALENSLIVIVKESENAILKNLSESKEIEAEIIRANGFVQSISLRKIKIKNKLKLLKEKYGTIAIFGAGHLTVAFISIMDISDLIGLVIDDNPNKKGLKMPLGNLDIVGSEVLYTGDIKICLLGLNPQNQPKVIEKHKLFLDRGGMFASIFPQSFLDLDNIT